MLAPVLGRVPAQGPRPALGRLGKATQGLVTRPRGGDPAYWRLEADLKMAKITRRR